MTWFFDGILRRKITGELDTLWSRMRQKHNYVMKNRVSNSNVLIFRGKIHLTLPATEFSSAKRIEDGIQVC